MRTRPPCRTPTISKEVRLGRIVGLPAVLKGRVAGRVERAVLTPDGRRLMGLILRQGMGSARWAAAEDVLNLGQVSQILRTRPGRLPAGAGFSLSSVKDSGGMLLGWVTDVYLDAASRAVSALEVDLGPVESLRTGRLLARQFTVTEGTGDVMIPCGCALERPGMLSDRR